MNVAALVGHTALRNNHMDRLDRAATRMRSAMRAQLIEALEHGALGLARAWPIGPLCTAEGNLVACRAPCRRRRDLHHAYAHRGRRDSRSHERSI